MFELIFQQVSRSFGVWGKLPPWLRHKIPLGKQSQMLRKTLGMTQKQLASRAETSQRKIVSFEKGEHDPRLSTLEKVADSLNCELLVRMIPRQKLETTLRQRARKKALQLVKLSEGSANLELQGPAKSVVREEIKRMEEHLLSKSRSSLWES